MKLNRTIAALALLPVSLFANTLEDAQASARADLEDALQRFSALQETIKNEKIPLARELNQLNAELREKRREAASAQRTRDNSTVDLNDLERRVNMRQEQLDYVANLVNDFGERFQRDISLAEAQVYADEIERLQAAGEVSFDDEATGKINRLLDQGFILTTAVERFDNLLGGQIFAGEAVMEDGSVQQGQYLALGPTVYFASGESELAGVALRGALLPPVVSIGARLDPQIRAAIDGSASVIPIDPSLGSALAIAAQDESLWEHIQKGGIWIWPILLFAGLATLTAGFKFIEVYSVKMPKPGILHDILKALNEGDRDKAMELAKTVQGPSRAMLVDAVEHSDESKELIEEVMYERMLEVQPKLERMLPFIAVTAATAPLMGLLGTVTGMINTFKLITIFGTGDAKQLSSGISEALVTTEFGLIVAIPALISHALLNRRAQGVMATMERMAVAFVNGLVRKN
jgi:biopolymer transport protein ExbB